MYAVYVYIYVYTLSQCFVSPSSELGATADWASQRTTAQRADLGRNCKFWEGESVGATRLTLRAVHQVILQCGAPK